MPVSNEDISKLLVLDSVLSAAEVEAAAAFRCHGFNGACIVPTGETPCSSVSFLRMTGNHQELIEGSLKNEGEGRRRILKRKKEGTDSWT